MKSKSLDGLTIFQKERIGKHTKYTCKCRNVNCNNKIKVTGTHKGYCRSCGKSNQRLRPYEVLYNVFLRGKKVNIVGTLLSYNEFASLCSIEECHYCKGPTIRDKYKSSNRSLSGYMIDRKDNSLPYTIDNCVSCCWDCNNLKSNKFTHEEFLKLRQFIKTEFGR